MSNGFLFVVTKDTSLKLRFKQTESRISRRRSLFEPRQISAAFCDQSKIASAASPRAASKSPSCSIAELTLAASCWSSSDFA
jgi:hypothetical protein